MSEKQKISLQVAELFAGVGGFRLGLESAGHKTVWANQWEPKIKVQHAYECYRSHFGDIRDLNTDIYKVDKNPLTWLDTMLNAVEHMNFFEGRATEYSKASTKGNWSEAFS